MEKATDMSLLKVLQYPDPRLRVIAAPVTVFDDALQTTIDAMFERMYFDRLVGLAATQVGIALSFFVMDVSDANDSPIVMINPKIISHQGVVLCQEGCGSVPDVYAKVKRFEEVTVSFQDRQGNSQTQTWTQLGSQCIQHEMEHLVGILFIDHLSRLKRMLIDKKLKKKERI